MLTDDIVTEISNFKFDHAQLSACDKCVEQTKTDYRGGMSFGT